MIRFELTTLYTSENVLENVLHKNKYGLTGMRGGGAKTKQAAKSLQNPQSCMPKLTESIINSQQFPLTAFQGDYLTRTPDGSVQWEFRLEGSGVQSLVLRVRRLETILLYNTDALSCNPIVFRRSTRAPQQMPAQVRLWRSSGRPEFSASSEATFSERWGGWQNRQPTWSGTTSGSRPTTRK